LSATSSTPITSRSSAKEQSELGFSPANLAAGKAHLKGQRETLGAFFKPGSEKLTIDGQPALRFRSTLTNGTGAATGNTIATTWLLTFKGKTQYRFERTHQEKVPHAEAAAAEIERGCNQTVRAHVQSGRVTSYESLPATACDRQRRRSNFAAIASAVPASTDRSIGRTADASRRPVPTCQDPGNHALTVPPVVGPRLRPLTLRISLIFRPIPVSITALLGTEPPRRTMPPNIQQFLTAFLTR
jgi:hypothetical protein